LKYLNIYDSIGHRLEKRHSARQGDNSLARTAGDKNYSAREKRLIADKKVSDAKLEALKAELKAKDARIKELRAKL
jgi:hypothetical protein